MRKKLRVALSLSGVAVFCLGALIIRDSLMFQANSEKKGNALLSEINTNVITPHKDSIVPKEKVENAVVPLMSKPRVGAELGRLDIGKIKLSAPVTEGTDDAQLKDAVGHLSTSVLPGQIGTSILAAHNITFFKDISKLANGDIITYQGTYGQIIFKVTDHKLVHVGDDIRNSASPSLILETCYPFDARYLTNQRYMVFAEMVSSILNQ